MTAADPTPTATSTTSTFDCPRCAVEVTERFWGPCTECRQDLARSSGPLSQQDSSFEATRFEPAMHVTPNHVATKD